MTDGLQKYNGFDWNEDWTINKKLLLECTSEIVPSTIPKFRMSSSNNIFFSTWNLIISPANDRISLVANIILIKSERGFWPKCQTPISRNFENWKHELRNTLVYKIAGNTVSRATLGTAGRWEMFACQLACTREQLFFFD